jgi:hypothetical protein
MRQPARIARDLEGPGVGRLSRKLSGKALEILAGKAA